MSSSRHCATADMDVVEVTPLRRARVPAPRPGRRIFPAWSGSGPASAERAAQQELDLGVGAAQLVGGPPGQGVMDRRIEP